MDPRPRPPANSSSSSYVPPPPPSGSEDLTYPPPSGVSSQSLPYRARLNDRGGNDEGRNTGHSQPRASAEPPVSSYPAPASAPSQLPLQTTSSTATTGTVPPSYNPPPGAPPHMTHAPPIPMPDYPQYPLSLPQTHHYPTPAANNAPAPNPGAVASYPPPPPAATAAALKPAINKTASLSDARSNTAAALKEYIALARQRWMVNGVGGPGSGVVNGSGKPPGMNQAAVDVEQRLRVQGEIVLDGLRRLREDVEGLVGKAEGQRWRRFAVGGAIASFIPLVKKLFRRPKDEDESVNRTEYAFKKSRSLVSRILASTHRPGLGTLAFFMFAVLYVFQNEVSLRVARTVSKRLKRLASKVEEGREELTEEDVRMLQGWRWRVLAWSD
ncbi:hypothetical protein VTI74DRAFT_7389 [Chaetomium olivicolor]